MKHETLEMIIEELSSALSLERWRNEQHNREISRLQKENEEFKKENKNA